VLVPVGKKNMVHQLRLQVVQANEHPCWEELLPMIKRNKKNCLQSLLLWHTQCHQPSSNHRHFDGLRNHPQWSVYGSQGCPHSSVSLCFLVLWNMAFIRFYDFPILSHHIGNVILPTDELTPSFFRGVAQPPTSFVIDLNCAVSSVSIAPVMTVFKYQHFLVLW